MIYAKNLGQQATLYDNAFIGVHYAHKVQTNIAILSGRKPALPIADEENIALLSAITNDIDVVIERSSNATEREMAVKLKASLQGLTQPNDSGESFAPIAKKSKRLVQKFADDALEMRNNSEETIANIEKSLAVIGTVSLAVVALSAFILFVGVERRIDRAVRWVRGGCDAAIGASIAKVKDEITDLISALSDKIAADAADQNARETAAREQREQAEAAERAAHAATLAQLADEQQRVVDDLAARLHALANGQLDLHIEGFFPEQYKRLRMDFNQAVSELKTVLREIRGSSQAVASAANELAFGAESLSRRAEHQAATLEEIAAAHDQMTSLVRKALEMAEGAAEMVETARGRAGVSSAIVQDTITAIRAIETSSSQITGIIGVIDEIAFQTNLLALNAGVEAARAGEAGRGFAVVAQEVRALAQRSGEAAKEIRGLIDNSTRAVGLGVDLAEKTGSALTEIVADVGGVADRVSQIAAASREQSLGLEEVNKAISRLDAVTQENAAIAEQTASACMSLTDEAQRLDELVAKFETASADARTSVAA